MVLDQEKDHKAERPHPHQQSAEYVNLYMQEAGIIDIWRFQNLDIFHYTWFRRNPFLIAE